jgi:hypothetical protein
MSGIRTGFRRFSNGFANGRTGGFGGARRPSLFRRFVHFGRSSSDDSNGFLRGRTYKNGILGADPIERLNGGATVAAEHEEESDESPPYLPVLASAPPFDESFGGAITIHHAV